MSERASAALSGARAGAVQGMEAGDVGALGALLGMRVKAAHAALHARMLERLAQRRPEYARAVLHSLLWQARPGRHQRVALGPCHA